MSDDEIRELFNTAFVDPDNAGLPLDNEGSLDAYHWTVPRIETEDALREVAPTADHEQLDRLAVELNSSFAAWARREDL
jgi:hypothetical protein